MKNLLIVASLSLLFCNNKQNNNSAKYIEFVHTGSEGKYMRPVFISVTKLNIPLTSDQLNHLKLIVRKSTVSKKLENEYLISLYDIVKTDKTTYSAVFDFIKNHKEFYTNKVNINAGEDEDYDVIAEGHRFSIFYKYKYVFFDALIKFLKERNCDKKVITSLTDA